MIKHLIKHSQACKEVEVYDPDQGERQAIKQTPK